MLTWEDAYYDNHEPPAPSESTCINDTLENLHDGRYLRDPLGLAVAKMSYLVYTLGEGIIGQVAVTGKHQWIFADKPGCSSWPSSEYCDGWQTQFSTGIKTIAVVAVVPYGVVQLGSLNIVIEDLKLVTHIREVFCSLHNSSVGFLPNPIQYIMKSTSCLAEVLERGLDSEISNDCLRRRDRAISNDKPKIRSHLLLTKHNDISLGVPPVPRLHQKKIVEVINKTGGFGSPTLEDDEGAGLLQPSSGIFNSEYPKLVNMKLLNNIKCGEETIGCSDMYVDSKHNDALASNSSLTENTNLSSVMLPIEKSRVDYPFLPSDILEFSPCDRVKFDRVVRLQYEGLHLGKVLEQNLDFQTCASCIGTVNSSLNFSACSELHEALRPAFREEQGSCAWIEVDKTVAGTVIEPVEGMDSSWFMPGCGSENLLEAVVASAFHGASNIKSENSFCKSTESLVTTEKMLQPSGHIKQACGSEGVPVGQSSHIEDDAHHFLSSSWGSTEVGAIKSPKELSSTTLSTCSEQLEKRVEPAKVNRKRARPGESCRPRPRDRQLIQDRIKELRELVPMGSKCSIDALLEQTIKHMLFLQSITKHANSLKKCDESKLREKGIGLLGSCSHEHGSSWAMEVGSQTKFCPIIVENLNMNGQMLIEMLCEECSQFLEIAEAIRGLGLTILKGATEARGERTWACFVVEGQGNKGIHRMDILWSLMHLLQPKTTA